VLVKMMRDVPKTSVLRTLCGKADVVACELVLAEPPRVMRGGSRSIRGFRLSA